MFASPAEMRRIVCRDCPAYMSEQRNPKRNHARFKRCGHYVKIGKFLTTGACANPNSPRYQPSISRVATNESCTHEQAARLILEKGGEGK